MRASSSGFGISGLRAVACAVVLFGSSSTAFAQTWVEGRVSPTIGELVAIDATGETNWLYGAEDLRRDGLDRFQQQEQSIDARTAYATAGAGEFWFRVYVSDANAPGGNISGYVFIDADEIETTGGPVTAPEIDPKFSSGVGTGYDYVLGVAGNGSVIGLWQWDGTTTQYVGVSLAAEDAIAETGVDVDPILLNGDSHGYLQGRVKGALVGVDNTCGARIYFRTVSHNAQLGEGDLDVGVMATCLDPDPDGIRTPPVLVDQETTCTRDDQCPLDGICADGACVIPDACAATVDCPANQVCNDEKRCVYEVSGSCTNPEDCLTRYCANSGMCALCREDADCGDERRCAPDGQCIAASNPSSGSGASSGDDGDADSGSNGDTDDDRVAVGPGQRLRGGAFTCGVEALHSQSQGWLALLGLGALSLLLFQRRQSLDAPRPARTQRRHGR